MKNKFKIILFAFYIMIANGIIINATSDIENEIKAALNQKYGFTSYIGDIINVDKEKNEYRENNLEIKDPYGTLKNCYIFTATVNERGILGIYKNGNLLWDSGPMAYYGKDQKILMSKDLNNDGKVEILAGWYVGMRNPIANIWIISWDGNVGEIINRVYTTENWLPTNQESEIYSYDYLLDIIDIEGDGVYEINGTDVPNTDLNKIYSWNGSKYGDFGVTMPDYVPMNLLTAKVSCKVRKSQYGLLYNYTVENDSTSKQAIVRFSVEKPYEYVYAGSDGPNNKWFNYYSSNWEYIYNWDVNDDFHEFPFDYLLQGSIRTGFKLETETPLVYIGKYYIQGKNGKRIADDDNLFENSFKGKTICGKPAPDTLVYTNFLDTLITYTDSSYTLGWITNEQTKDKYNNYFTNTKNYLNQSNNNAAKTELQKVLTDCNTDSSSVLTSEAYALLYFNTDYLINRIPEGEPGLPVKLQDSQGSLLQGGSLQYYDGGWKDAIDNGNGTFTVQTERTTVSLKMHYAGGSQQKDNVTVGADTAVFQTSDVTVKLLSSQNTLLDSGFVQYYASGWQDFGTLVNGTAHKELLSKNYTFKVKYAGSDKNKVQNLDTSTTVTFHTVNTEVQLQDSQGNLLNGGEAEYYASGWKIFGELTNGKVNKELLSRKYTFKVKYAGAENNLVQDLDSSTTVIFHTVNTTVQLKDSQGNLLDGGFAQYYAGGWQDFGAATNGVATKELLPKSYNFKMKYGGTDKDIVQDITNNSTVTFQTVNAEIQLRDSQGNLLDGGFAKYYASGWKDFGTAANGIAHKELLSRAYTFKIQYGGADINHVQNLDTNTTVVFNTINVTVQLKDSQGNLLDSGEVEYYASGWKTFGSVVNGTVTKELLPRTYTFKMIHGGLNTTKDQDVSVNSTVNFATTLTTVRVKDNQGQVVENAEALYYGGGWKQIGFTNATGEVSKELLGRTITFKAKKDSKEKNKQQDTSTNSVVEIILE